MNLKRIKATVTETAGAITRTYTVEVDGGALTDLDIPALFALVEAQIDAAAPQISGTAADDWLSQALAEARKRDAAAVARK